MHPLSVVASTNLVVPFHALPSATWFESAVRVLSVFYRFVSLADLDAYFAGRRRFNSCCHITFDDGHISFYEIVFPILRRLAIPATLFVSPRVIREGSAYWFQELTAYREQIGDAAIRMVLADAIGRPPEQLAPFSIHSAMLCLTIDDIRHVLETVRVRHGLSTPKGINVTIDQLREIAKSGLVTVGAHTNDHPVLGNETDARVHAEITGSVSDLADLIGQPVVAFAYPNGTEGFDFGPREQAFLREAGVRLAVSTDPGFFNTRTNPLAIPRGGCPSLEGESDLKIAARLVLLPIWPQLGRLMSPGRQSEAEERGTIRPRMHNAGMTSGQYTLSDLGHQRILSVDGKEYRTHYSKRVIQMLVDRKGIHRTPPYLSFKETRRRFLDPLFRYFEARGVGNLKVLEVGCSFGHFTEYLNEQAAISEIRTFDVDRAFVEITRAQVEDLGLTKVREVRHLTTDETRRLPFDDGQFDLVLAIGVVEHLPFEGRHRYVDSYYRVLKTGGFVGFFDTPNRFFPFETHSVGLPGVQWLPPELAFGYAKALGKLRGVSFSEFTRPGTAWRNASYYECLPKSRMIEVRDLTEEIGYGYGFFKEHVRSRKGKLALPVLAGLQTLARWLDVPPSFFLPYLNLVFQKAHDYEARSA
jgi:peptidoglycan/xylan/chitin deacetylase (PgdA/CDA1 family)/SAM-dependent methyltransferase